MKRRTGKTGFTLLELTVVVAVMVLLAATAVPTILGMFSSGTDAQAYNMVVAILGAARAQAIQTGQYVCVRFEKAIVPPAVQGYVVNADHEDTYWCAVLTYNPNHLDVAIGGATPVVYPRFEPDPAVPPRRLPGMMAAGEVSLGKTVANDGTGTYLVNPGGDDISADALYRDFTTFNIIFGPNGNVVRLVNGKYPEFGNRITCSSGTTVDMAASRVLFNQSGAANQGDLNLGILWADPSTTGLALEPGVTAMTIFDSKKLKDSPSRSSYLYDNAQILAINQYTGQLFARK